MFETGLEVFLKKEHKKYRKLNLGVLCNQASVTRELIHISKLITDKKLGLTIKCFFGPQHGIRGEKQDNMIESDDFQDPETKLPVYSLYGTSREPSDAAMKSIDALIVDLQDVGTRIYTFMYTLANCMRIAKKHGKKIVVLDRPNPINGLDLEGNVLEKEYTSFVGQYPICVRHGMTMGELALLFNEAFGIGCDLEVVPLKGWSRKKFLDELKWDWVSPSPNLPSLTSAIIFPGAVIFEGTHLSEGRGTTHPFEWIGAPYVNPDTLAAGLNKQKMPGVYFRPIFFQPTYQKWKDEVCGGVQIHVTDRIKFRPFEANVALLTAIYQAYPNQFQWKSPPYEYEYTRMPIDLIAGTPKLRSAVESGKLDAFEKQCDRQLSEFRKLRKKYLLYKK